MYSSVAMFRVMQSLACLLVLKTVAVVLLGYRDYFPPNFDSDFLHGRDGYFGGPYRWAFYVHLVSGPFTLLAGLVLLSEDVRRRFPQWHRNLGRAQVACIVCLMSPSAMWMSWYAESGRVAGASFALLSIATTVCAAKGWLAAVGRRFAEHRRWMQRCFVLLCSAVALRVFGGLSVTLGADWTYPYTAWLSWLLPLLFWEFWSTRNQTALRHQLP